MSEPKRWLEEDPPRDIELLMRAARAEEPSEASLRRSLSAVGAGLATLGVTASAGAAGTVASVGAAATGLSPVTASVVAKWAALGATLGTLTAGTATLAPRAWERLESDASVAQPPVQPGVASTPAAKPAPKAPTAEPHPTGSIVAPSSPPPAREPPGAAPEASISSADETLMQEVRSVDRARAALAAGRPGEALARLDDYERDFPERRFGPEALYLRMEALVSLGRTAQARTTAERLLARHPNSPHGERARAVLSKNP